MMKYGVYQYYPEEGCLVLVSEASSEEGADTLCNAFEKERAPGKPYRYVYKELESK